jgi:hypothetical protein
MSASITLFVALISIPNFITCQLGTTKYFRTVDECQGKIPDRQPTSKHSTEYKEICFYLCVRAGADCASLINDDIGQTCLLYNYKPDNNCTGMVDAPSPTTKLSQVEWQILSKVHRYFVNNIPVKPISCSGRR